MIAYNFKGGQVAAAVVTAVLIKAGEKIIERVDEERERERKKREESRENENT